MGRRITCVIVNCPLGRLLVAAPRKGICGIRLGDSDTVLEAGVLAEYPAAEISRDGDGINLSRLVDTLISHLNGQQPHLDLPLDVQATAFQRRVWEELRSIPYGSTRSYSQVARSLGEPKATRAVARACPTHPLPLVIPCHRVVREDGNPGRCPLGPARQQPLP